MKKLNRALAAAVAGLLVFSMAGCGGSTTENEGSATTTAQTEQGEGESSEATEVKTAVEGKLIWATNAEFPPYEFHDTEGGVSGIDAEISAYIAEQLGLEVQCEDMQFDSVIPAVTSGKVDMGVAGMTVTEDRLQNVNFSTPYVNASQVIIVKADSEIAGVDDLTGKTIGVQLGTTGDTYVTENIDCPEPERYNKGFEAVQALTQGKVDAVVIDNEPAKSFVSSGEGIKILDEPLTTEEYAIAISKDNEALLEAVNGVLADMEESGKLSEIISKYIGDDAVEIEVAEDTEAETEEGAEAETEAAAEAETEAAEAEETTAA